MITNSYYLNQKIERKRKLTPIVGAYLHIFKGLANKVEIEFDSNSPYNEQKLEIPMRNGSGEAFVSDGLCERVIRVEYDWETRELRVDGRLMDIIKKTEMAVTN
jgi:hypothetical protein